MELLYRLIKSILSFGQHLSSSKGQSLVELIIAIGLSSLLLPPLLTSMSATREGRAQQNQRLEATSLHRQAYEAVRSGRERDWNIIATNGTFHPSVSDTFFWDLLPGSEQINGFTRAVTISDAYRDSSGNIVSSGGTIDPSTKKIITSVSWNTPLLSSVDSTVYLTRFSNEVYTETTDSQFNNGSKTGVVVTNTNGGEVVLAQGGRGEWCEPSLTIAAVDLPKQGVANAISAVSGQVVAGTGENASGVSFANVEISNPPYPNPPAGTIDGTFDGYKTNDVFGEENYAYLATDNNSKEVVIIDLTHKDGNGKYSEVGYFDTDGQDDAIGIYVSNNRGYVTAGYKFYIFDLNQKTGARPQIGSSFILLGTGTGIAVNGNYAYVSLADSLIEMQIIDISNPQNIFNIGFGNVNGSDGKNIFVNQSATRAYLVTGVSSFLDEFFVINIEQKTGFRPIIGGYNANGMNPKDLAVATNNKAIIVGTGGEEYQVLDVSPSNEAHPLRCGGLNVDTGINGIATVSEQDGDIYAYITTGDANSELKIIEGGPGGQYSPSGTFESQFFDATKDVAFNNFSVTFDKPVATNLRFWVAARKGDCSVAVFNFVGPDGTENTYFSTSSAIPLLTNSDFENPGRCFKYKVSLSSTDSSQTPVLYDMTINYSL